MKEPESQTRARTGTPVFDTVFARGCFSRPQEQLLLAEVDFRRSCRSLAFHPYTAPSTGIRIRMIQWRHRQRVLVEIRASTLILLRILGREFQSNTAMPSRIFRSANHDGSATPLDVAVVRSDQVVHCPRCAHLKGVAQARQATASGPRLQGGSGIYTSLRPSMAFSMVTSSVYSMSLPTGMPMAIRVTRSPCRFICWAR
jgi:hypothetical protein